MLSACSELGVVGMSGRGGMKGRLRLTTLSDCLGGGGHGIFGRFLVQGSLLIYSGFFQ